MTPISFVITLKNRTRFTVEHEGQTLTLTLLEKNLRGLIALLQPTDKWEIVIVDFGSDDVNLTEWLPSLSMPANMTHKLVPTTGPFNRGRGLNIGKQAASHPIVFFFDADMLIRTRRIFDDIERLVVAQRKVLFPICWSYSNPEHTEGWKRVWGLGNVIQRKGSVVPYIEKDSWGKEDYLNFANFCMKGSAVRTYYGEDYVHQWHPNDMEFKNKYYAQTAASKQMENLNGVLTPQQIVVVNELLQQHI
jgi:glycosyltransferase involved in cell wall biosynthesis